MNGEGAFPSMSILAPFLPSPRIHQVDRRAVAAPPERAWEAVRHLDVYRIGFARALFALRTLPDVIAAKLAGRPSPLGEHSTLEDLTRPETGFRLLAEYPGRGFIVGSIGRFWETRIEFRDTSAETFAAFSEPGWGKLVWGIEVAARECGGSWIAIETRVTTTDDASFEAFQRYWTLIGPFSRAIRRAGLDLFERDLGAAPPPDELELPGDDLLAHARYSRTHHAIIEAPPERVWPWLAQMGGDRAGWYSLDFLDNRGVPSAETIHPEWQSAAEGDLVRAMRGTYAWFGVLRVEPHRHLILGSPSLRRAGAACPAADPPIRMTWAFVLEPVGEDATLLCVRVRADSESGVGALARHAWAIVAHEIMQREQLVNLKRRAEAGR